jgi:lipoate---protein ligase
MKLVDLTAETPAANLAMDEALLDFCEMGAPGIVGEAWAAGRILRFWESPEHFVVLGYGNRVSNEVDVEACRARGIPILRRCSGGGTVLQGPGCLNYALVLPIEERTITDTNCEIMRHSRNALRSLVKGDLEVCGHTDLAINNLKVSGNSQRRRRDYLLFHGSFLLNFDLTLITELLKFPTKQPEYRRGRSHREFLTNLRLSAAQVKFALQREWEAIIPLESIPKREVDVLIQTRYSRDEWNFKW